MTIVGGNLESKEIGLPINLSGTHYNTVIDSTTGYLTLKSSDTDALGNPVYTEEGYWISDTINLEDKFADFDKLFTTEIVNGASSFSVQTRVSDNGYDWSEWVAIAMDGTIQSETKQYIQIKINLYAGFVTDTFVVNKGEYIENNKYVETKSIGSEGYDVIPSLTSNTSSNLGFAFSSSNAGSAYLPFKAFDKLDNTLFRTGASITTGFVGFYFNEPVSVISYKVKNWNAIDTMMAKKWVLQASDDTTTGLDGTWENLDSQENQVWNTVSTFKEFTIKNKKKYKAYRINILENNGGSTSAIGELGFYVVGNTLLQLKREHELDMTLDTSWTEEGSLHRKLIKRDEWVRIDKMNVLRKI